MVWKSGVSERRVIDYDDGAGAAAGMLESAAIPRGGSRCRRLPRATFRPMAADSGERSQSKSGYREESGAQELDSHPGALCCRSGRTWDRPEPKPCAPERHPRNCRHFRGPSVSGQPGGSSIRRWTKAAKAIELQPSAKKAGDHSPASRAMPSNTALKQTPAIAPDGPRAADGQPGSLAVTSKHTSPNKHANASRGNSERIERDHRPITPAKVCTADGELAASSRRRVGNDEPRGNRRGMARAIPLLLAADCGPNHFTVIVPFI